MKAVGEVRGRERVRVNEQQRGGRGVRRPRHWADVGDVLGRLAARQELPDVLHELVVISIALTGADSGSVLLLDGERLVPAVASGGPSIDVDRDRAAALLAGSTRGWVDIFDTDTTVLVPVLHDAAPLGLLALDWHDADFDRDDIRVLEAVAAYAGSTIAAADRRRRLLDAEHAAAAALSAAVTVGEVAEAVFAWATALLADVHAVAVVDVGTGRVTRRQGGAEAWTEPLPRPLAGLADPLFAGDVVDAPGLLADLVDGTSDEVRWCIGEPLRSSGRLVGGLVIGTGRRDALEPEQEASLRTTAAVVGSTLERVGEERARRRELAGQLLAAVTLLARRHAEVLPEGSEEAASAVRLADLATSGWLDLE